MLVGSTYLSVPQQCTGKTILFHLNFFFVALQFVYFCSLFVSQKNFRSLPSNTDWNDTRWQTQFYPNYKGFVGCIAILPACIYVCIHIWTETHTHTHTHTHARAYVCICVCASVSVFKCNEGKPIFYFSIFENLYNSHVNIILEMIISNIKRFTVFFGTTWDNDGNNNSCRYLFIF